MSPISIQLSLLFSLRRQKSLLVPLQDSPTSNHFTFYIQMSSHNRVLIMLPALCYPLYPKPFIACFFYPVFSMFWSQPSFKSHLLIISLLYFYILYPKPNWIFCCCWTPTTTLISVVLLVWVATSLLYPSTKNLIYLGQL